MLPSFIKLVPTHWNLKHMTTSQSLWCKSGFNVQFCIRFLLAKQNYCVCISVFNLKLTKQTKQWQFFVHMITTGIFDACHLVRLMFLMLNKLNPIISTTEMHEMVTNPGWFKVYTYGFLLFDTIDYSEVIGLPIGFLTWAVFGQ